MELRDFFHKWILMAGNHQPNSIKISLFCHNKIQKPYLTSYSVNKFYKVRNKNGNNNFDRKENSNNRCNYNLSYYYNKRYTK